MTDSSFTNIFDIIEILAGIYIIYAGIRMKTTGVISSQLVGKDVDIVTARDPKGFINAMFPYNMICGIVFVMLGAVSLYIDKYMQVELWVNLLITGTLLVVCIIFAYITKASQDRYLK